MRKTPPPVQKYVHLKQITPYLSKVVAVTSTNGLRGSVPPNMVLAPKGKTDQELLGSFLSNENYGRILCPSKKVSCIIPTYAAGAKLARCLATLRSSHDGLMDYEIIVSFDGGPNVEAARELAARHSAKFIERSENGGFSATVNDGIRACDPASATIILVNDDLWFEHPSCAILAGTVETNGNVAIAGARLLYPDRTVQHGGVAENGFHIGVERPAEHPSVLIDRDSWAVTGALFAISKGFLDQCGRMDEQFRMAWEDTDLCMSARMLGWKIRYCGAAWALHEEGGTRGRGPGEKEKLPKWTSWENKGGDRFRAKWGSQEDLSFATCAGRPLRTKLKRILVKRTTAYGDVLLTTPVLKAIKDKNPEIELVVATAHGMIFRDNPAVSYVIPQDHRWVNEKTYDVLYDLDLAYEKRPYKGILEAYEEVCGVKASDPYPSIYLRDQDREFARGVLGGIDNWIAMHVQVSRWPGKDWDIAKFNVVARGLQKAGFRTVLLGTDAGGEAVCDLDLRGKTSFHHASAVIERTRGYVGKDSLPLHMAQAFKKPLVGIFGSIDPTHILVPSSKSKAVMADPQRVDCLGCHHRRPPMQTTGWCHRDRVYCMEELSAEAVLTAALEVLS